MNDRTIVLDGHRFTRVKGRKYYYNSTLRRHLHQYVWEKHNGPIPKGFQIHHIDHNTENNNLSNLEMLSAHDHAELHVHERVKNNPDFFKRFQEKGIKNAPKWHKSKAGHEWHKKHFKEMKDKLYKVNTFVCDQCGKRFESVDNNKNRFCSNKCKSKYRRDHGLDDEERICLLCHGKFTVNKYSKTTFCGKSCAAKYRWLKRKKIV